MLTWLSAEWWQQGAARDGLTRFTWRRVATDMWSDGEPGYRPGGRGRRLLQEAVDNLMGAVVTLSGYNVHTGEFTPALFSDVHILRSVVGKRRKGQDVDYAWEGGRREDTVEVRLEDWLVAQLLGDSVAMLDWQIQRQLTGLAKRLWCYLAGRDPDFTAGAWPEEEGLVIELDPDVYAAWSLNSKRESDNRAAVKPGFRTK